MIELTGACSTSVQRVAHCRLLCSPVRGGLLQPHPELLCLHFPLSTKPAMSSSMLNIMVSDTNAEFNIDYLNPSTRAITYRDLRSLLSRLHNVNTEHREFADRATGDKFTDSTNIDAAITQLQFQPVEYQIRVQLYAAFYPVAADDAEAGEATDQRTVH